MIANGSSVEIQDVPVSSGNAGGVLNVLDVGPESSAGPLRTYTVCDGVILGKPGILAVRRGGCLVILRESVCHPDKLRLVADQALSSESENISDRTSLESACLLDGHWSPNIWHWFMDWLPRAVALEATGFRGTYLVPHGAVYTGSLQLLGVPRERLMPRPPGVVGVDRLTFTQCINGRLLDRWPWLVVSMRQKMVVQLPSRDPPRRLYIGRRGVKRRVINEAELLEHLEQYGFTAIFMEDYPIDEQIWFASGADVIIGPHGAGMVFSMFMKPGGVLIELFHSRYVNPCMTSICNIIDLDYRMLVSSVLPPDNFRTDDLIVVNLPVLDVMLRRVMPRVSDGTFMARVG